MKNITLLGFLLGVLVGVVIGIIVGQWFKLPFSVNADISGGGNRNTSALVKSNPVVVNPSVKSPMVVRWKTVTTKINEYFCPDGYLPVFPNVIFPGSGTKSDPFFLRFTVDAIVRDGKPYNPNPIIKGPMEEDYVGTNVVSMISLLDDRIGLNPRKTHHDDVDYISVDYYQYVNDVLPKYLYYPKGLTAIGLLNYLPYLKESEVVGAKIRKTPFDNNPSLVDICAGPAPAADLPGGAI